MATPAYDAIIVGSGAGGGVAAYVLAANGWKVALVEKGRNPYPTLGAKVLRGSLFGNDEIKHRRAFSFHDPFIEPRVFKINDMPDYRVGEIQSLGVAVGGGTIHYDGDHPRAQRYDFKLRTYFGDVPGADVVDWPIEYADVAPYFDEVERIVGVQGEARSNPFEEPRNPYPMPPGGQAKAENLLVAGARALGLNPHPMPIAVNSIHYRGRPACVNCGFCAFGCPINAKSSTAVSVIRDAVLTGNCDLVTEACVFRVDTEPSGGKAAGVSFIDRDGTIQSITGRHVVIGCNALETPRLMLESASAAHPDGLGNGSGLVGRYLMFHIVFNVIGLFNTEIRSYRGRVIKQAIADWTTPTGAANGIRGGYTELGGQIQPVEFGATLPWDLHKPLMVDGGYRRRISAVSMMGEDMPQRDNRVELDPHVKDVYGRPVIRITYKYCQHDRDMIAAYMPKMEEIAKAAGAASVMRMDMSEQHGAPDTKHLSGTTRMGDDPSTSVCDRWGRLHELENVWIVDGSTWPTSASFNPVNTQQALAYRTAAYLVNPADPLGAIKAVR